MLRTWVFEFLPELTDQAAAASQQTIPHYIGEYLSLWERDEALGFDGIFFSEHHFGGSFSASPILLIAATAARTKAANCFNITGAPEGFFVQFEKADGKIKNLTLVQGPRSSLVL